MSDDVEARIRTELHDARLPASPDALREYLVWLRSQPVPVRQRRRPRPWIILAPVAAALIGIVALAGGSSLQPSPSPSPVPSASAAHETTSPVPSPGVSFPATVDGLTVQTVSELLASRAAGQSPGGPYALHGYWTDRSVGHSCVPARGGQPGELEFYCHDGEFGITELDEPIWNLDIATGQASGPVGPHLSPFMNGMVNTPSPPPDVVALFSLPIVNGQRWPPVPIVVVGHFDDPRAADCRQEARQLCLDRFIIDRVAMFDPKSVPAPTQSPNPRPAPSGT